MQEALAPRIAALALADRHDLHRLLATIEKRERASQPVSVLRGKLEQRIAEAEAFIARRRATEYVLEYPESLPISRARPEILAALEQHRVIVVCGDTGSGKTTQLPKICLEAGRGIAGAIGHTQPRRIAARAVAARLAEELHVPLGRAVGYQVRFTDETDPASLIKVMTDGILLNEIRHDRLLHRYDTLIIDEAHERSLNIDFLLGFLKQLGERRADLKIIVTSATIDPGRFAAHFGGAPVVTVEGRSFPVELRYRPPARDEDWPRAVTAAADELARIDLAKHGGGRARDMLVFLPGERWIRDAERELKAAGPAGYEILPLYARLTAARQQRVFQPGAAPRIVLATNIAETSLTVPRIRFVVDSGLARVNRYSPRHRMQALNVEPIAKANAVQRAGRCGRLAPGLCIRLYAEEDFDGRPEYMEPEILRTDLAGVILRLEALRVGHVDEFPFIDPPPIKAVNDAYRLLHLLGAMDAEHRLTPDGDLMARLPLDPRLARLLLVAERGGVLREALVIAAALSVIDPREQPAEQLGTARQRQAELNDARSDFMTYLNLWGAYRRERRRGEKAFRAWCANYFLSPTRFREWDEVHHQLKELALGLGWRIHARDADYEALHRAVLAGFIDFVAEHADGGTYEGLQQSRAALFPGSTLAKSRPQWIVAAERVATERVYLRTAAQIKPAWIADAAAHLIKREHREPFWDRQRGRVTAREMVSLQGLILSSERRVDYGRIDPAAAREIFIRDALAAEDLGERLAPLEHNRRLRDGLLEWEARRRSRDLFAGPGAVAQFYESRLPPEVVDRASLRHWARRPENAKRLEMCPLDIATRDPAGFDERDYPLVFESAGHELPLAYVFDPVSERDGISLRVPLPLLAALRPEPLEWLVPGWLPAKVLALLRSLPKDLRRRLVPLPDTVAALGPALARRRGRERLAAALQEVLAAERGTEIDSAVFEGAPLPAEFSMRIEVVDASGAVVAAGRDLPALQRRFLRQLGAARSALDPVFGSGQGWARAGLTRWEIPDLPPSVTVHEYGTELALYPALVDVDGRVDLTLLPPGPAAVAKHRGGVRRLLLKSVPQQAELVRRRVQADRELVLSYHGIGSLAELVDDLLCAAADEAFVQEPPIRGETAFAACLEAGRSELVPLAERLILMLRELLPLYRALVQRLERLAERVPERAVGDVGSQLDGLIHPYFLRETPAEWRPQLPRYLKAVALRLDKLEQRSPKDAENQAAVEQA
ncbi:MAG TPA: ATP-dependent RNA helicase HrpA, partial [Gammaproteobacteria bacterium]|nr:ATP-dependent RNA helicase HrpA [Gammaproteobacteria bacterium]